MASEPELIAEYELSQQQLESSEFLSDCLMDLSAMSLDLDPRAYAMYFINEELLNKTDSERKIILEAIAADYLRDYCEKLMKEFAKSDAERDRRDS